MTILKSERGPRNVRLTILVPQSTMDDLRALRESTFQSTGDLLNNLIEAELIKQSDAVKDGYTIIKMKESRRARTLAKANKGKEEPSSGASSEAPSQASPGASSEAPDKGKEEPSSEAPSKNSEGHSLDYPTEDDVIRWSEEAFNKDEIRQRKVDGDEYLQWLQGSGGVIGEESAKEYAAVLRIRYTNDKTYRNHKGRVNNFVRWWSSLRF